MNATVRIRFDYYVDELKEEGGFPFLMVFLVSAVVIVVVLGTVMLIRFIKRRVRDASTFFDPDEGPFYVFKSIVDSRIYYFDPNQYAHLYNSSALSDYEFVGTSTRMGGPITPPEYQGGAIPTQIEGIYAPTPMGSAAEDRSIQQIIYGTEETPGQGYAYEPMQSAPPGSDAVSPDASANVVDQGAAGTTGPVGPGLEPGVPPGAPEGGGALEGQGQGTEAAVSDLPLPSDQGSVQSSPGAADAPVSN